MVAYGPWPCYATTKNIINHFGGVFIKISVGLHIYFEGALHITSYDRIISRYSNSAHPFRPTNLSRIMNTLIKLIGRTPEVIDGNEEIHPVPVFHRYAPKQCRIIDGPAIYICRGRVHTNWLQYCTQTSLGDIVQWLSSQICNVCALLETSTKFGILVQVDMVAAITSGYRTTSTAPTGGWRRHLLNLGTWCHTSVHNFGSRRDFFILFSDLYSGDVYSLSVYYLSTFQ